MINRKRDLSIITPEQEKILQAKLASKLSEILSRASTEANEFLNQYGIEVKIAYSLKKEKLKKSNKS